MWNFAITKVSSHHITDSASRRTEEVGWLVHDIGEREREMVEGERCHLSLSSPVRPENWLGSRRDQWQSMPLNLKVGPR